MVTLCPCSTRFPPVGYCPCQTDSVWASHRLQLSQHCPNMAPQGPSFGHCSSRLQIPQSSHPTMGCSPQAAALVWAASVGVSMAVAPSGHIHHCTVGSSVTAHGDLLHVVPVGTWNTSYLPSPLTSVSAGLLVMERLLSIYFYSQRLAFVREAEGNTEKMRKETLVTSIFPLSQSHLLILNVTGSSC